MTGPTPRAVPDLWGPGPGAGTVDDAFRSEVEQDQAFERSLARRGLVAAAVVAVVVVLRATLLG